MNINIIPEPMQISKGPGVLSLSQKNNIFIEENVKNLTLTPRLENLDDEKNYKKISEIQESILNELKDLCQVDFNTVTKAEDGSIQFLLDKAVAEEAYAIKVSEELVQISVSSGSGFFYAVQSLKQLINENKIPVCEIQDAPHFSWRGLHLDMGRFFQPLPVVKRFIDQMSLHKLNVLHWHLTEDQGWRLEIKKYPKLTEIGSKRTGTIWGHYSQKRTYGEDNLPHEGFYSQEEVKELVAYARDRAVMIMPEIDLPGHSRAAIAAYPELGVFGKKMDVFREWGVCKDIYNPEESTINFLKDVLDEVVELFPSPWIHIGGDEAVKNQWKKSPRVKELLKERGLKDNHEMQSWFIKQMAAHLKEKGRTAVGWDEIMEGGAPDNAVIMAWRHEKHGIQAAQNGLDVLMCPCQKTYLDYRESNNPYEPLTITGIQKTGYFPLERFYSWNPLPEVLTEAEKKRIMGGQGQVWTEYMPSEAMISYMTWPRASALAEILWRNKEGRDFKDFSQRLKTMTRLMDKKSVAYHKQGELQEGGIFKCGPQSRTIEIPLDELKALRSEESSLQILFRRKGWSGYASIEELSLICPDGRTYTDKHVGYAGKFQRLNIYTLGDGTPFPKEGSRLIIKVKACSKVPSKEGRVKDCQVRWAYRT